MVTRTRLTAEDLWRMGEGDVRRELVDGQVIEMPPAGGVHGRVLGEVGQPLRDYVKAHGGGVVLMGDVGFRLGLPRDPERVRTADIAFVSHERLPGGELPEDKARTVTVYRPDGSAQLLTEHGVLDGEDVLPGLQIRLSEMFG